MQNVTTKAMAKVAAVATGLAMASSMLSLAPIAHAAMASCTFTTDLTVGSKGAAVTCLQNALIAGGYSLPAGATGYFGSQTKAAVIAWQTKSGVSPAAGYFGAKSRAVFGGASTNTGGNTGGTVSGTGLQIALSATSPSGSVLVQGQGIGDLADFTFTNPSSAPINVKGLSFKRIGVSNDQTLTNVYLYNGGTRITDSAGVSASSFSYSDPVSIFSVPANGSVTISVRSDILTGTSGQQLGVQLVSASTDGTLGSSVSFPINSGLQTISAANLATVSYSTNITPSTTSISPQSSYPVWQDTVSVSVNPVWLKSLRFTNLGSISSSYVGNLRLYVDGVQAGSAVPSFSGQYVTFDLSGSPVMLTTSTHTIKVLADITGGANRTIILSVQRSSDAMFVDSQLGQPVTPQYNSTTFQAVTTGTVTINSVSGASGVSVSLDPASPTAAIAVGASSVEFARFDMLASGENVKVNDLYVVASTSIANVIQGVGGLANGKILVNGVQVGSTKSIGTIPATGGTLSTNQTDFSLGSSLILPAGQTTIVSVYGDAKDTANTNLPNGTSVTITLLAGSSNAQGQSSLNSANVPASNTSSNAIAIQTSSLTATKYTGYGNQTIVAGSNNAKLGQFTLAAGSTEGVTVNTIVVALSANNAASITNLTIKDDSTGNVLGTVITTPSTSNSYSISLDIPRSATKTFSIYGNILSGANAGAIIATVKTTTTGTGDITGVSASVTADAILQSVTVGSGTLTITRGAGDPVSNNVLAGASSVLVGEFNFAAQNSSYTVQNLAILVPFGVATSVTNVTVSYKDVNGATQTQSQSLAVSNVTAGSYATATFTGLTMYVPTNDSANVDVYVGTPTIASGATSGAAISVLLDAGNSNTATDNTFRALNSAGSALTVVNSAVNLASNGTFYVRKSIPTFAMKSVSGSIPGSPLYQFTISADPAGAIEWSKLVFAIATTSATVTNAYLTDDSSGTNLLDNTTTSASTTATAITVDLTKNATAAKYAQVAAGSTKTYDLYGTVSGFTTGSTVTINLTQDTTFLANGIASASGNTSWSDRSATSHTISTSDWTNGYLVKNFTNNQVSYSK